MKTIFIFLLAVVTYTSDFVIITAKNEVIFHDGEARTLQTDSIEMGHKTGKGVSIIYDTETKKAKILVGETIITK